MHHFAFNATLHITCDTENFSLMNSGDKELPIPLPQNFSKGSLYNFKTL